MWSNRDRKLDLRTGFAGPNRPAGLYTIRTIENKENKDGTGGGNGESYSVYFFELADQSTLQSHCYSWILQPSQEHRRTAELLVPVGDAHCGEARIGPRKRNVNSDQGDSRVAAQ
jgi:hypothetical protein